MPPTQISIEATIIVLCVDEMKVYSAGVSKKRTECGRQYQHICNADRVQDAKWGCMRRSSTASEGRVNMKSILVTGATFLVMFAAAAHAADDTEALIALDKQWGESIVKGDTTVSEKLLADKVVSVDENGVMGKQVRTTYGSPRARDLAQRAATQSLADRAAQRSLLLPVTRTARRVPRRPQPRDRPRVRRDHAEQRPA